jgi:hypothetical protein
MNWDLTKGAIISDANFRALETHSWSCRTRNIDLYHTAAISSSNTWNKQPRQLERIGRLNVAHGYNSTCQGDCVVGWLCPELRVCDMNGLCGGAWIEQRGTRWRVRFRNTDGTVGTDGTDAALRCKQVDIDQAYDTYLDPNNGRITLAEWVSTWQAGHEASPITRATYTSYLRNHILPRFGQTPINKITRQDAKVFAKQLKQRLVERTVADVMSLLSLLLREAVADRRIGFNPCHGVRVTTGHRVERTPATADQINRIAERIRRRSDQILVVTAAYTGMRWGELAGLAKANTHLGDGLIKVHPDVGALHEVSGTLYLGPPKSAASVRDIHLPPFLITCCRR